MKTLLPAVLLIAAIGCSNEQASWPATKFDSGQWKRSAETDRYVFARDLVESHTLVGKPANEVKDLLGTPSSESDKDHRFAYVIKTGGKNFDQVYVLDVVLNPANGIVESVLIRGD
jgi:hypothetical protein